MYRRMQNSINFQRYYPYCKTGYVKHSSAAQARTRTCTRGHPPAVLFQRLHITVHNTFCDESPRTSASVNMDCYAAYLHSYATTSMQHSTRLRCLVRVCYGYTPIVLDSGHQYIRSVRAIVLDAAIQGESHRRSKGERQWL